MTSGSDRVPPTGSSRPQGLVGRDDIIDELESLAARALDGSGSMVLLAGEAGIGKTSLARALTAAHERPNGCVVGELLPRPHRSTVVAVA